MEWVEAYNQYLSGEWARTGADRKQDCFHCSELGYCMRKAIYRRSGVKLMPDPGKLRRLRQGTLVHNDMEQAWLALLPGTAVEVALEDGLPEGWVGTSDAVRLFEGNSLVDLKTVNPNSFRYASELPKTPDCLQVGSYWWAAERMWDGKIEKAEIIYFPLAVYDEPIVANVTPDWKEAALREMAAFEAAWKAYQEEDWLPAPPGPEKKSKGWQQSWECSRSYCDYRASGYCEGGPSQP